MGAGARLGAWDVGVGGWKVARGLRRRIEDLFASPQHLVLFETLRFGDQAGADQRENAGEQTVREQEESEESCSDTDLRESEHGAVFGERWLDQEIPLDPHAS